jgi:hypothetical protein
VQELFPLAAGVTMALVEQQIATPRIRIIILVVLSPLFGTIASFISGELAESWGFILVDTALVLLGWALARVVFVLWRLRVRRYSSHGSRSGRATSHDLSGD